MPVMIRIARPVEKPTTTDRGINRTAAPKPVAARSKRNAPASMAVSDRSRIPSRLTILDARAKTVRLGALIWILVLPNIEVN